MERPIPPPFEAEALRVLDDVARFASSLTRDSADAEDLVQETYLRAFRSRHTWRDGSEMRRWLFTICKNAFLRSVEQSRDTSPLEGDPEDETLAAVRGHGALVARGDAHLLDRIDLAPAIDRALRLLPEAFRVVVVLVDMEEYGYADAAEILGVPIGTVRSRLFRGRRLLQELLVIHAQDAGLASVGA